MKIQVIQTLPNGQVTQQVLSKTGPEVLKIQSLPGAKFSFNVEALKLADGTPAPLKTGHTKKVGNNLVLELEGEDLIEVVEFYSNEGATVGNIDWNYISTDPGGLVVTPEAQALATGEATQSGALLPVFLPGWGLFAGAATVAAVAIDNADSTTPATPAIPQTVVSGTVTAGGPLLAGHGLTVLLYKKDGTTWGPAVKVNDDGTYTTTLQVGAGEVVIVKVIDATDGVDYKDTATNLPKDLNAVLQAAGVSNGKTLVLNVNALTSIAVDKAGPSPDAAAVGKANADVGKAFGMGDISGITPDVVTDGTFDGTTAEGRLGAILGAISGADTANGGNTQATLDALKDAIDTATGTLSLEQQAVLIQGAAQAEEASGMPGVVEAVYSSFPPVDGASTVLSGTITLGGALLTPNGLTIQAYKEDGTAWGGPVAVDAKGGYTTTLAAGAGQVVIVKVLDASDGTDYTDAATQLAKDLNGVFQAAGVTNGGSLVLNVNALTSIAVEKAGPSPDAGAVLIANGDVAQAFGVGDITKLTPDVVTDGAFDGTTPEGKLGAVLGAISGTDVANGGDTQKTLDDLTAGVNTTTDTLTPAQQAAVIDGAAKVEDATNMPGVVDAVISNFASQVGVTTVVNGTITAGGPLLGTHGLTIQLYKGDGTTWGAPVAVDANGFYTMTLQVGGGQVVIAKVIDADTRNDYTDTVTKLPKDLNALLEAAGVSNGATLVLNVNALTSIAVEKAGPSPDAAAVLIANTDVGKAFGVGDIIGTTPDVVTDGAFDGTTPEGKLGAVLGAISGTDVANGGDTQKTLDDLTAGVNTTTDTLTPAQQAAVIDGAAKVEETTGLPGVVDTVISNFGLQTGASTVLSGTITLGGALLTPNGLTIQAYKEDGTAWGGPVAVDAKGGYTTTLAAGAGQVVIVKVLDASDGTDYTDAATQLAKDLNGVFQAAGVTNGGSLVLNVNALTSIAVEKAGPSPDAGAVLIANGDVAQAFGVGDITKLTPDVVTDGAFDGTTPEGKLGAVLGAISGTDVANGGDTQKTLDDLTAGVNTTTDTLTPAQQAAVIDGAAKVEDATNMPGVVDAVISNFAPQDSSNSVSINKITADNILDAFETTNDVISQTTKITGTNATGAKVVLAFGIIPATGVVVPLTATTWEYVLTSADVTNLGADGGKYVTATATLSGGSTATASHLFVLQAFNQVPLVTAASIALLDTAIANTFSDQGGTLVASDAEGATLTYGIKGSVAGTTVNSVFYDVSKVGTYGTLYVKASTGEYVYVANAAAINAVSANQTEAFTVTASDGILTGKNLLTVNITGANDTPVVVTPAAITLTDTANADVFANQTGTLASSDAEGTARIYGITGSVAGATVNSVVYDVSKVGTYGTLYVKASTGEYVYVANAAAINAVSANQTEAFTVTASDGILTGNNLLTVNITGANDTPVVVNPAAITLTDTAIADVFANQTGTLASSDAEGTARTYGITGSVAGATVNSVVYDVSKVGTYGTLYVKASTGEYVYVANAAAINAVSANQTEAFTVTASDGILTGNNLLTVNITGANDTPVVVTPAAITLTDTANADVFANQTGTLASSDAEGTARIYGITGSVAGATVNSVVYDVSKVGTYGTLYVKASTGDYVYVANAAAINAVSANQTEAFTVTASDGILTGKNLLTVNITGANDTPVVVTPAAITLTDTANADVFANQTGTLASSDAEGTARTYGIKGSVAGTTVNSVVYDVSKVGTYGTLYVKASTGDYVYVANAAAINAVSANQTEAFTVTASDGILTGNNLLTVNITGANDTPVVVNPAAITLTDTAIADVFANQTGTLASSDAEGTARTYGITGSVAGATVNSVVYDVSKVGTYGTLYVKASTGEYVYVANAAAINAVSANQTEAFTVTASDGILTGNNLLTVNITGANDTPVVVTPAAITLTDTANADVFANQTGTLASSDAEGTARIYGITGSVAGATVNSVVYDVSKVGTYGTLYVKASTGDYVYVANAAAINAVSTNQTENFVVTATDGALTGSSTLVVKVTGSSEGPAVQSISVVDGTNSNTTALGKAGETLDISLVFSEAMLVTGSPTATVSINGQTATATYNGVGSGTSTLHFTVAIPSGSVYDGSTISLTAVTANVTGKSVVGQVSSQPWDMTPMPAAYTGYTIDNTAPATPAIASVTDDTAAITGLVVSGATTNDTTPTVRVSFTNSGANAVVAGNTIQLFNGAATLGSAVILSGSDVSSGVIEIATSSLTNGITYSLNAKVTDAAGNSSLASNSFGLSIDTAPPVISAVAFGTTTGTLKVGDTLTTTITADQSTYTAGAITVNGKAATGFVNNGNNTYTVSYTVAAGDTNVLDSAAIPVSVVLIDAAGNSNTAFTTAPVFSSAPGIDTVLPTITGVAVNATGAVNSTLNVGDVITATVDFSESVTATAGSTIGILVGSTTRLATVTAGTGTSVKYTYTVTAGDVDADGISVPAAGIVLNSGAIKDVAGNNALLTYTAVGAQAAFKVDTAAPVITASYTVNENTTSDLATKSISLVATNETGAVTWTSLAGADAASFSIGSGADLGKLLFNGVTNFEVKPSYSITLTGTDLAGNATVATPVSISVANVNETPSVAVPLVDQSAFVGQAFSYVVPLGSFIDPDASTTLIYSATLANGAALSTATGWTGLVFNASTRTLSGVANDATTGDIDVRVTASDGSLTISDDLHINANSAPILTTKLTAAVTNFDVGSNLIFTASESVAASSTANTYFIHITDLGGTSGGTGYRGETDVYSAVSGFQDLTTPTTNASTVGNHTQKIDISTAVANGLIEISGSGASTTITINPMWDLDLSSDYSISIDAGAFVGSTSGLASVAFAATNFSTVTPGTTLANSVLSTNMSAIDVSGFVNATRWVDIEGNGSGLGSIVTNFDASTVTGAGLTASSNYTFVMKDTAPIGGDMVNGIAGVVVVTDFAVRLQKMSATDRVYIDDAYNNALIPNLLEAELFGQGNGSAGVGALKWGLTGASGDPVLYVELAGVTAASSSIADVNTALLLSGVGYNSLVIAG